MFYEASILVRDSRYLLHDKKLLMFFYLSLTAGALTRHVNSVHLRTGKTKECPICGYTTASLLNLNSHLSQTHHLGEDIPYHEFKIYVYPLFVLRATKPGQLEQSKIHCNDSYAKEKLRASRTLADIATAFARPSNSTKGKPAPKPEKKDPRGPQSQQHAKTNGCGGPPEQSPPSPNPTGGAAPSHHPHPPPQPPPPPHQPEMHGPSAAAAVAAKAATAAELVTQYNLAQLHAAYNELNRNRVAAAAAAQAMADHRASALQQAAAMTAAAAENSPPRYPLTEYGAS